MIRVLVGLGLLVWIGATLALSEVRWFARPRLSERLAPFQTGRSPRRPPREFASVRSLTELLAPLARQVGDRFASFVGVGEELALRLERVHSPDNASRFRLRQLGASALGLGIGVLASVVLGLPATLGVLISLGLPVLAFLILEQRLATQSANWQRRLFLELPVVAEQLAMLLAAGFSLGAALNRLAARSAGATGRDLAQVCRRIRQGVPEDRALREWAQVARVEALSRLVAILALHTEASDLGRLVSEEARSIRQEVHRAQVVIMERRAQQVWIPVTVATLVPGVIFLAIPFIAALHAFAGG